MRSEKELLKAAGTSQEKTIVLMDDVVVNGDLKVAAPNKIDLNGFGLEVKGTLSADGSGTLVVGTTALILARRETVKAQKIDINMPQGHVEWNAHIDLPASAATSAGRDDGSYLRKQLCVQGRIQNRRRRSGHYAHPQRRQV